MKLTLATCLGALILVPVGVGHAQEPQWTASLGAGKVLGSPSGGLLNTSANLSVRGDIMFRPAGSPLLIRLGGEYVRVLPAVTQRNALSWTVDKVGAVTLEGVVPITSGKVRPYVALGGGAAISRMMSRLPASPISGTPAMTLDQTVTSPVLSTGVGLRTRLIGIPLQVETRWLGLTDRRIAKKQWVPLTVGFWF